MPFIHALENRLALLDFHRHNPELYPFLLQSSSTGPHGRFDILFAFPQQQLIKHANGMLQAPDELSQAEDGGFLAALDDWFTLETIEVDKSGLADLPFYGGWFVYLGYELATEIEPGLPDVGGHRSLPVAMAIRMPAAIILDRHTNRITAISETADMLQQLVSDWEKTERSKPMQRIEAQEIVEAPDAQYLSQVERIRAYIRDGDVFQVNLSRPWQARFAQAVDPATLYQQLVQSNPAPFAGLMRLPEIAVLSSSPERLVSVRGRKVETRPIAGTRPREQGQNDELNEEDLRRRQTLINHPKERAEHVMLIDLERNDLGRVCVPGTVRVDELMAVESYSHVHHIVSNISGELRAGVGPADVIRGVFPGGTITGCPKVRCMEILTELEQTPREAYTGSMGYINIDGDMDLNILIRTMVLQGDRAWFRAGGGIVFDSIADKELMETRSKARGLLRALEAQPESTA